MKTQPTMTMRKMRLAVTILISANEKLQQQDAQQHQAQQGQQAAATPARP